MECHIINISQLFDLSNLPFSKIYSLCIVVTVDKKIKNKKTALEEYKVIT